MDDLIKILCFSSLGWFIICLLFVDYLGGNIFYHEED